MVAIVQQPELSATVQEETRLNHIIALHVPRNDAAAESTVESVAREFSQTFGGASIESIEGYWINAQDELIRDTIARVYAFHNDIDAERKVKIIAERVKIVLNQESVLIESDGGAILV